MNVRPMKNQNMRMNISMSFSLHSLIEFDETNGALKTGASIVLFWTDEYLRWNKTNFNGIYTILLPQDDIWKPVIALRNPFASFTGLGSPFIKVDVFSLGTVIWKTYQVLQSTCEVDIRYFPFDVQTCSWIFAESNYFEYEVRLTRGEREKVLLGQFTPNSMWDIQSTAVRDDNLGGLVQSQVVFEIKLKRKPGFYIINIILPIMLLSILATFSFVLPITSCERSGFSVTVFLSLAVFLTIVAASLPKNSDIVSFLTIYLILMTVSSTVIVVLCLVEARLATRNTKEHPIGNGFLTVYKLANILGCKVCRRTRVSYEFPGSFGDVNWIHIVDSMDVLLFIFFMLLTIVSPVVIFVIAATH